MGQTYHKRGKKINGYFAYEHPSYNTWAGIKSRCRNSNSNSYKNYGGRSIDYCAAWEHFENFCKDMGVRPSRKHTIERVDNDKGYYKSNCTWILKSEQPRNRRKFSNNTSGFSGVKKIRSGRFTTQYNEGRQKYRIGGSFETAEKAAAERKKMIARLKSEKDVSHMLKRPARFDCRSKVRGITIASSGYIVRMTNNSGERIYIGHFSNLKKARKELEKWKAENL